MKKLIISAFAALALVILPGGADAQTPYYYTPTTSSNAQIQMLLQELTRLQNELARLKGTNVPNGCYMAGNIQYCFETSYTGGGSYRPDHSYNDYYRRDRAREINVEYRNNAAYIEIEYSNGRDEDFIVAADDDEEVIEYILDLTDLPRANIIDVIDFEGDNDDNDRNDDDIRSIDVEIDRDDNEAEATVRYDDGDRDTFDYDTDDKDEIIENLADDLDIDEDEVEDLVDFKYVGDNNSNGDIDDIDSIDVDFRNDNAYVRVEWEDGDVDSYVYYDVDEDEDEVIERLSDDLDIDEDDLEDFIDWN